MKPSEIVSLGICAILIIDFVQTLFFFSFYADAWFWKKLLASASIELGFLAIYSERDLSVLAVAVVVSIILLAETLAIASFVSLAIASFLLHYLIETFVDEKYNGVALFFFVPTVWMTQGMHLPPGVCSAINSAPIACLFTLFATQGVLKICF
jgi:hypothetical protein